MELWLVLGILAYFSYAISSAIDKHLMDIDYAPYNTSIYKMFFDGIILLLSSFLFFDPNLSVKAVYACLFLGGIYAVSSVVYYKMLQIFLDKKM
jgi:drug/metabolite transporter (DMT)-like permease